MQDQLMQLVQLLQYRTTECVSISLSNKVMNLTNDAFTANDLRGYQGLGFDTSSFNKEHESFSFDINTPIHMVQYCDSHTWRKCCRHFINLDLYEKGQVNKKLHGPFCSSMIDFLSTDLGGTATYLMNPNILSLSQLQQFLLTFSISKLDTQQISSMCDQHLKNSKTTETVVQQLTKIAISSTVIPISIFTRMMYQRFSKLQFLELSLK